MDFYDTLIHELTHMRWSDYLDIIVVAYLIYRLLLLLRSAGTLKIVRAVFAVFVVLWLTDILCALPSMAAYFLSPVIKAVICKSGVVLPVVFSVVVGM